MTFSLSIEQIRFDSLLVAERYGSNQTTLHGFNLHLRADAMLARHRVEPTAGTSRPAHVSSRL